MTVLLDTSVWSRFTTDGLPEAAADVILALDERDELATCLVLDLEVGCSARSLADHSATTAGRQRWRFLPVDPEVEAAALRAQAELAAVGHHRLALVDVMVAAVAHVHRVGVLHYDADYDVLAERTSLRFESRWIAPRGSL